MNYIVIWLFSILIFSILEGITTALVSIWFVVGSILSLISALLGFSPNFQLIVFIIGSIFGIIILYPCTRHFRKIKKTEFNSIIGCTGTVVSIINNKKNEGEIYVKQKKWKAKSLDDSIILKGTKVTVKNVEGVTAIVNEKNKN